MFKFFKQIKPFLPILIGFPLFTYFIIRIIKEDALRPFYTLPPIFLIYMSLIPIIAVFVKEDNRKIFLCLIVLAITALTKYLFYWGNKP